MSYDCPAGLRASRAGTAGCHAGHRARCAATDGGPADYRANYGTGLVCPAATQNERCASPPAPSAARGYGPRDVPGALPRSRHEVVGGQDTVCRVTISPVVRKQTEHDL